MQCLVVYDIPDDKARTKIADICLDYGLDRIQFSAFLGELARTHQEALMGQIKKTLGKKAGHVQLVAVCEKDWRLRIVIKQEGKAESEPKAKQAASQDGPARSDQGAKRRHAGQTESGQVAGTKSDGREIEWIPPPEHEEDLPPF